MNRYVHLTGEIVLFVLMFFAFLSTLEISLLAFSPDLKGVSLLLDFITELIMMISVFLSSFIILRYWDKTNLMSMGFSASGRGVDFLCGSFVAIAIYVIGFSISLFMGLVSISEISFDFVALVASFALMCLVAITEETMFRGFMLGRMLAAGLNKYIALIISAFLFSLFHALNPNFDFLAFLNIFLAGILLGSTYIFTRNLWFSIALHLFWNWVQGPVLGYSVSGNDFGKTLFSLTLSDNVLLNGGAFGFESSLICTLLQILAIGCILWIMNKKIKGSIDNE